MVDVNRMASQRITNLDFIRGIAVLGIFLMNSVFMGLPDSAYWNHSSAGIESTIDWILVIFTEIFVAQKFMALFSILFGASIVIFIDHAERRKSKMPKALSIWRNFLLLCFGMFHATFLFDGDILVIYALCAPIIIVLRKRNLAILTTLCVMFMIIPILASFFMQYVFDANGNLVESLRGTEFFANDSSGLGAYWFSASTDYDVIGLFILLDGFFRAASMMLLGIILYRLNVLHGNLSTKIYQRMALYGLLIGLPLSTASIAWLIVSDYSPAIALWGFIPNKLGIIPLALAYVGLLSIINNKVNEKIASYIKACGKMALTNYITQSILGLIFFQVVYAKDDFSRTEIILLVFFVWAIQLIWSRYWLSHFSYGPLEWLWRKLTYLSYAKVVN